MDFKALLGLTPQYYGELTVDATPGGVGFDAAKLTWNGMPCKLVRATAEGGDFRAKETGEAPTTISGDLLIDGDEIFVPGEEAARNFRAIRTGGTNATLRYHVYF